MAIKSNTEPLIEFNPKLPRLSSNEKKVLKLLVEAGKLITPLYLEQEKHLNQVVSKEEIEKLAKKDPAALSPYTVVEKIDGEYKITPYHVKYEAFLNPIADKLYKASEITDNKEYGRFLKLQAKALLDGSYEAAIAASIKIEPYILDISIGPIEYHSAYLSFAKASYQAWVGILDIEGTKRLNNYKRITLSASRKALAPEERIENLNKVKAKTIDVILFSGFMARTKFVGVNLPMDANIVQKHGSEITIFNQPNDLRLKEQVLPIFETIFSKSFQEGFSSEDIRRGNLRYIALHELAHSYLYYKNAVRNLKDLFITIFELAATVLGLRMAGPLLLEDVITSKQLESMIVAFMCRSIHFIKKSKANKYMINHAIGGTIFINFMIESGSLKYKKGILTTNFMKVFVSLNELSYMLERLLSSGTRKDAEAFILRYGQTKELLP